MQKELSRVHVQVAGVFYILSIGDQLSLLLNQAIYCNQLNVCWNIYAVHVLSI